MSLGSSSKELKTPSTPGLFKLSQEWLGEIAVLSTEQLVTEMAKLSCNNIQNVTTLSCETILEDLIFIIGFACEEQMCRIVVARKKTNILRPECVGGIVPNELGL